MLTKSKSRNARTQLSLPAAPNQETRTTNARKGSGGRRGGSSKQWTDLEDGGEDGAGATAAAREGPGAECAGVVERPYESGPRGQRGCAPITSKIQER